MKHVWRVIHHGVTTGRDSGYPIVTPCEPLFLWEQDAQDEADRRLAALTERSRTIKIETNGVWVATPVYEVRCDPVLSPAQSEKRLSGFAEKVAARYEERASRLEEQAAALRAKAKV